MPASKRETHLLLPVASAESVDANHSGSSSTSSSSSSEDDDLETTSRAIAHRSKVKLKPNLPAKLQKRNRHQLHRGARRVGRLLLCTLLVPLVFLVLYMPMYTTVQTRHVPLPDWGFNTSRNIVDYVLPENDTVLIEPRNICREKIFLLIVVSSGLNNFATRQTIRETWGNTTEFNYAMFHKLHANFKGQYLEAHKERVKYYSEFLGMQENQTEIPPVIPVRVVFLVGRSKDDSPTHNETLARLHSESLQYDDIIQQNFLDSYNNLTLKSVMSLKWVTQRCLHNAAFYMKCDLDTFVNIPNLLHVLLGGTVPLYNDTLEYYDMRTYQTLAARNRLNSTTALLMGHLFCTARPVSNVSSKWYMPYYMYSGDKYPLYLSGAGYVMSMDTVLRLYEAALNTTFIYLEDVYLTGICADRVHLKRRDHPLFSYTRAREWCSFKGSITQHELKEDFMLVEAYASVVNTARHCPPPGMFAKRLRLHKQRKCA